MCKKKCTVLFIITLLFLVNCQKKEQKNVNKIQKVFVKDQVASNRIFKSLEITEIIDYGINGIYEPIVIKVDNNNDIYIYDLSVQKIKLLKDNKIIEYGEGRGKGPKAFGNIIDYDVNDNILFVADAQLRKISEFKKNGEFIRTKKLDYQIHRILLLKNRIVILQAFPEIDKHFILLDKNYNLIKNFGRRIENWDPQRRAFFMEGNLCSDGENTIFYGHYYHGLILSYDIKTDKYLYVHTIDNTPMPEINAESGGYISAPRDAPISCRSISYDKNKLYVLSLAGNGINEKKYTVFDVYNAKNIEYEYSFKIPAKISYAFVKNNIIYGIVNELNLISWKIKPLL